MCRGPSKFKCAPWTATVVEGVVVEVLHCISRGVLWGSIYSGDDFSSLFSLLCSVHATLCLLFYMSISAAVHAV